MAITTEMIKQLREATGAGILDCRKALENAGGDYEKAVDFLREKGLALAAKRGSRTASEGVVELYSHGNGRVGVMVEVNCETDFVARTEDFQGLVHDIAMQIAAADPQFIRKEDVTPEALEREKDIQRSRARTEGKPEKMLDRIIEGRMNKFYEEVCLLEQPFIKDNTVTVHDLVKQKIAKLGENIVVARFVRMKVGDAQAAEPEAPQA